MTTEQSALVGEREIVIYRTVNAPRELVWRAWTQVEHLERWWGPDGFTTTTQEFDMRPGGVWRVIMHGPDGTDYKNRMVFREVTPPERLVYVAEDEGEGAMPEFIETVTFDDVGGKTRVTMRAEFPSTAERERVAEELDAIEGGRQALGRLAEYVSKMQA